MEDLFEIRKIEETEVTESSHSYYNTHKLKDLTIDEIKTELDIVENDIKTLQKELDNAGSSPSYVLRQRLNNAMDYRSKLTEYISKSTDTEKSDETKDTLARLENMKKDLERQYEKGIITKSYRDKYIAKIEYGIDSYKEKMERQKQEDEEKEKKAKNKKHLFKKFKSKLQDYKK